MGTQNAIASVKLTQLVNDGKELSLGSACANMLEADIITPEGALTIAAGTEVKVFREENGTRHQVGLFTAEKPTRPSPNRLRLTAYDRVSKLDKDLTAWLAGLTGWPYRLYDFAAMVCKACGLTLKNTTIPNGELPIQAFSAEGITGRQLMRWASQAAGRFCRATAQGEIELSWYQPTDISYGPTGDRFYYQNGLTFDDYQVAPIEKVQLKLTDSDVGTVYPDILEDVNTYTITSNYLLTTGNAAMLAPVAQSLYEQLKTVTYTPCKLSAPASMDVQAGDIIAVTDRNGRRFTAYVMKKTQSGQRDTLECTGSQSRDSTWAVNNQTFQALSGKVLELGLSVEGLEVENRDAAGNRAALALRVDAIESQVARQEATNLGNAMKFTKITQEAEAVKISVENIQDNGVSRVQTSTGYTFAEDGLRIQKSGQAIENRLDHTGMYVTRSGETMLRADQDGVLATDVTVRNYLVVGDHARFEDYTNGTDSNRTACFFV